MSLPPPPIIQIKDLSSCVLVIAAVGAVSYVASSSSASSSSSKMTNINSNQMQMQMQGGSEFTYVGEGWCVDDNPNDYDDVTYLMEMFILLLGIYRHQADAKECGEWRSLRRMSLQRARGTGAPWL